MTTFTLGVGHKSGTRPTTEVTDYTDWVLNENLDDGFSISFNTSGASAAAQAITELATDLWLYQDGVLKKRARITNADQEWDENGANNLAVTAVGYRRMLKNRFLRTALSFSQIYQGDIVWALIQHIQAADGGDLGITAGALGTSILRDRNYEIGQDVFELITNLSNVINGISWDIDADLVLTVGTQTSFPTVTQPVQLGVTARRMSRPSAADQFANAGVVTGNNETTTPVIVQSATILTDPRGRWEKYLSLPSTSLQTSLVEAADGMILETISPLAVWRVVMESSRYFLDANYQVGDYTKIRPPASPVAVSVALILVQCVSRQISQNSDGGLDVVCVFVDVAPIYPTTTTTVGPGPTTTTTTTTTTAAPTTTTTAAPTTTTTAAPTTTTTTAAPTTTTTAAPTTTTTTTTAATTTTTTAATTTTTVACNCLAGSPGYRSCAYCRPNTGTIWIGQEYGYYTYSDPPGCQPCGVWVSLGACGGGYDTGEPC